MKKATARPNGSMMSSNASDSVDRVPAMAPRIDPAAKTETFIKEEEVLMAHRTGAYLIRSLLSSQMGISPGKSGEVLVFPSFCSVCNFVSNKGG